MAKDTETYDVVFKGTKNGLIVKIHPDLEYDDVEKKLFDKLKLHNRFLSGADVLLDWGERKLDAERLNEFRGLLAAAGLNLKGIVEETMRDSQPDRHPENAPEMGPKRQPASDKTAAAVHPLNTRKDTQGENLSASEHTILIQRTIRSGQTIHYPGNIVILGDVNPGAEIVAGGNIVVMGHFRGVAHAGATGDESAIVTAFRLQPSQLRIANHFTRAPDNESGTPEQPEIARVKDGTVVIESYQPWGERQSKR